jgi:hypothetical protein
MKKFKLHWGIVFLLLCAGQIYAQFNWRMNEEKGTLTLFEKNITVLTYCYGDQLKAGAPFQFERACYIHPLNGLDGTVLTADFPPDHLHHHGLFWTWPEVTVRGQKTQTWHPANLRQHFSRWIERDISEESASLKVENAWKIDKKEVVAREIVSLKIHRAAGTGRKIDLTIRLEAVGGPMVLRGAAEGNKGYGGLCFRGAEMFTGAAMTTDRGRQTDDATNARFKWADLSTEGYGITITVLPGHPDYPIPWLIRRSYAGILNPSWPGLEPVTLEPGSPAILRYQILIHRGNK